MPDSIEAIALRPSIIRKNWLPLKMAVQEVLAFERHFGKKHLLLACHAALPSYLTAELLNLIHLNFLEEEDIPWIAEADFLLSPLCRPVDEHLFEVEPAVREVLLVSLKRQYGNQQGEQRLVDLAAFLQKYLDEKSEQIQRLDVINTLRWIARSYLEPDYVIEELRKQLDESLSTTEDTNTALTNQAELAILLEKIAEPLERSSLQQDYNYLIHDSRVIARQLYADDETSTDALSIPAGNGHEGDLTNLVSPALLNWVAAAAPSVPIPETITAPLTPSVTIEREVERLLTLAGWIIQDYAQADIRAEQGVAIRNFPTRTGDIESIDYLLFVDQQAAGVIFVMEDGQNRIGLEEATSLSSRTPMLRGEKLRRDPIPFTYETNAQGSLIRFTSYLDPVTRTRSVFAFHRPETFALWLQQAPPNVAKSRTDLLRARLRHMPSQIDVRLRNVQYEAIANLEKSLAENHQRSLIQMPTGSGKTTVMVNVTYRLLKFGNARRILYLADRTQLVQQTQQAFEQYILPDDEQKFFTDIYTVEKLSDIPLDPSVKVCIGTIQQLHSVFPGLVKAQYEREELDYYKSVIKEADTIVTLLEKDLSLENSKIKDLLMEHMLNLRKILQKLDEIDTVDLLAKEQILKIQDRLSNREITGAIAQEIIGQLIMLSYVLRGEIVQAKEINYNPLLPIEAFDIIFINESHRAYEETRHILDYFDAFFIGLTSIEDKQMIALFSNNVVYQQKLTEILFEESKPALPPIQQLLDYGDRLRTNGLSREDYLIQLTHLLFLKMDDEQMRAPYYIGSDIPSDCNWQSLISRKDDEEELELQYHTIISKLSRQKGLIGTIFFAQSSTFTRSVTKRTQPKLYRPLLELIASENWTLYYRNELGLIYDNLLLENVASSTNNRRFMSRALTQAIIDVMQPEPGLSICDPTCGTGEFLIAIYQYLNTHFGSTGQALEGWEASRNTARFCAMNLFLHYIVLFDRTTHVPLHVGDNLRKQPDKTFDMALTLPTFGRITNGREFYINEKERDEHFRGTATSFVTRNIVREDFWASTNDNSLVFIQHIYSLLHIGGHAAIVVPDKVLFAEGAAEIIRGKLLQVCDLHTILRLPRGIFSDTKISANVLFFDKVPSRSEPSTKQLWIYDLRTNINFSHPYSIKRPDFDNFVIVYNAKNRHNRLNSERFRAFTYDELLKRDHLNLDIFWLQDNTNI